MAVLAAATGRLAELSFDDDRRNDTGRRSRVTNTAAGGTKSLSVLRTRRFDQNRRDDTGRVWAVTIFTKRWSEIVVRLADRVKY